MLKRKRSPIFSTFPFLPNNGANKIVPAKNFVTNDMQILCFIIINGNPNAPIIRQKLPQKLQPRIHQGKPSGMFHAVIIMLESGMGIVGWIQLNDEIDTIKRHISEWVHF